MKDNLKTLLFAVVLGLVCAGLLGGVSLFTASYREANEKAEEVRNFLNALAVPVPPRAGAKDLLAIFERNLHRRQVGALTVYDYVPEGSDTSAPVAVAVPFEGLGLWAPIKGVIALKPDMRTIIALRFYKQEETPGLGGEISTDWFVKQFAGKWLLTTAGQPCLKIVKPGSPRDEFGVDGITAATMTTDRVQNMLKDLALSLAQHQKREGP